MTPLTIVLIMVTLIFIISSVSFLIRTYMMAKENIGKCLYIIVDDSEFFIKFQCVICGETFRVNKYLVGSIHDRE